MTWKIIQSYDVFYLLGRYLDKFDCDHTHIQKMFKHDSKSVKSNTENCKVTAT